MSSIPADLQYTPSHTWVRTEADGSIMMGITDHAQAALGDVVFIELPEIGRQVQAGEAVGLVESVKTASDIQAPVSGTITAINSALSDAPEQVNETPYAAWLFQLRPESTNAADGLLDASGYGRVIGE